VEVTTMAKAAAKISTSTVAKQVAKGTQDVVYDEILNLSGGRKVKVSIRSDSYDFQSHAKISSWDGAKWHEVHRILHSMMKTPHGLYYRPGVVDETSFKADRDELIRVAEAVTK
jgi:hypothetical protein